MGNVLAFCELSETGLRTSALANLTFAREAAKAHGGDVLALVIGKGTGAHGAAVAAYISVRFLARWFTTRTLWPFGVYCLVAGLLCVIRFA